MSNDNINTNPVDKFGRAMGALKGIPDVIATPPNTTRAIMPIVGTPQTFIVQTFRKLKDAEGGTDGVGDTLFIQHLAGDTVIQIVCPPDITKIIARQRDSLSARTRKRGARAGYETRRAKGTQVTPPKRPRRKQVKS